MPVTPTARAKTSVHIHHQFIIHRNSTFDCAVAFTTALDKPGSTAYIVTLANASSATPGGVPVTASAILAQQQDPGSLFVPSGAVVASGVIAMSRPGVTYNTSVLQLDDSQ